MARIAISFSAGIRTLRNIQEFAAVDRVVAPAGYNKSSDDASVLVWGHKETGRLARRFAKKHSLPVLHLEDGFIRTCSENPHSRLTYSVIVDRKGIYYDAAGGSELEDFLNSDADFQTTYSDIEEELTQACLELIVDFNITKYNYCVDFELAEADAESPIVLVIDQTVGDASVTLGGMDQSRFEDMLEAAIMENPESKIWVKTHPDVIAGKKSGYLTALAKERDVKLIAEPVNPISLLKAVDKVYVGTSQMGMEALLCEKPVTVFGKPFYAGWGLTDDRADLSHRTQQRTLRELFFAVYLWYPRYCHPVTGQIWTLPECLEHVIRQKQHFAKNARQFFCVGITPWKRRYIRSYLRSPAGRVEFGSNRQLATVISEQNCDAVVGWSYREPALLEVQKTHQMPVYRLEDGFIRSSGLGSDFNPPGSLVMDSLGLYFNAQAESDIEQLLNLGDCTDDDKWRARQLIKLILSAKLSKYNVGTTASDSDELKLPSDVNPKILVVGQVESDASLQYGGAKISTNALLVQAVRRLNPDAWIAYKPHPDVLAGNRKGKVSEDILGRTVDRVIVDTDIIDCIEAVDELHTMTSLSGFEALLRGKTVKTYGTPFYAGWGLTTDLVSTPRRTAKRSLEELVYYTLIVYPTYMDVDTGEFLSPEDMVAKTRSHSLRSDNMNWTERQITKVVNVVKGLGYAP